MPENITVIIELETGPHLNAHFNYRPGAFRCKAQDTITWRCLNGPFALHFGERSLFTDVVVRSGPQPHEGVWVVSAQVADLHQPGEYNYTVAVDVQQPPNLRGVWIDSCPGGGYDC